MLAVVKEPHIEISLTGKLTEISEMIGFLRSRYSIDVLTDLSDDSDDELVNLMETDFWKETTPGDLLMGFRLKHEITQEQLSEKSGIHQVVISDYETGKRKLTMKAATKFAKALGETPEKFFP